jgi:hypothetical protein
LQNYINEERIAGTLFAAPLAVLSQLHGRSAQRSAIAGADARGATASGCRHALEVASAVDPEEPGLALGPTPVNAYSYRSATRSPRR